MRSSFFPKLRLITSAASTLFITYLCYLMASKEKWALAAKLFMVASALSSQTGISYAFLEPQHKQNFTFASLLTIAQLALHTNTMHNFIIPITMLASLYLDREKYYLVKQALR